MPLRPPAGFIRPGFDPLENPDAPTIGAASAGNASASVAFTPPANVGGSAISEFYAVSDPEQVTVSGASSPINVTGLTNGTAYTFTVWALNTYGPGPYSGPSGSVTPDGSVGIIGGGDSGGGRLNTISFISLASTGNSTFFGQLTVQRYGLTACASSTRAVFAGGNQSSPTASNVIDFVTIASAGNATDFGDITANGRIDLGGASSETRGIFIAGNNFGQNTGFLNVIDFITIASAGNATDFGDTTATVSNLAACSSTTRAVYGGGYVGSSPFTTMGYLTIASAGNAISFGNLDAASFMLTSCSNSTRGLFAGGRSSGGFANNINTIQFITIASESNATDFGDLTSRRSGSAACSSSTRAVFIAGLNSSDAVVQTMDFVNIASTGNATTFGNLEAAANFPAGTSNAHGGL